MSRNLLNALIVTPETSRRAHLKLAIHHAQFGGAGLFGDVHATDSLQSAAKKLRINAAYELILITDSFNLEQVKEFIGELKYSRKEKFGFVYVLRSDEHEQSFVADLLVAGVDSYLCEPFSVDMLNEITELAQRVRRENLERRISSAAGMIVGSMADEIDTRAEMIASGKHGKPFSKKLVSAKAMFKNISADKLQHYYDALIEATEKRKPARRHSEDQEEYTGPSEILRKKKLAKSKGK